YPWLHRPPARKSRPGRRATRAGGSATGLPRRRLRARSARLAPGPPLKAPVRKKKVLLPTEGREAHVRPGRIVVLEATKRGRPWPKWIVCPSWVAGRVIAYGIGVRRIGAASPGRYWNWRP